MMKPSSSLPSCYVTDLRRKSFEEPAIVHPGVCSKPSSNSFSLSAINMCTVDAYVSPLSLCQQQGKAMVVSGGKLPLCSSENSFTSVDINGLSGSSSSHLSNTKNSSHLQHQQQQDVSWHSWKSDESTSTDGTSVNTPTGCCFDLHSGLMSVTRAITGSISADSKAASRPYSKSQHHRVDITDNVTTNDSLSPPTGKKKKLRMSSCSIIGIFFITLAIVGVISVGIAMYVEFVTKPSVLAASKLPLLNETTLCDYLLDSCNPNSTAASLTSPNGTEAVVAAVRNESGRIEGKFSPNFISQISGKLPK